ncbi:MAG: hypothetical protein ABI193_06055 [Minicystis sp.]
MRAALLFPALVTLVSLGCASTNEAVRACAEGCPTGKSCIVGRCRAPDEPPSPPDTRRVLLAPTDLAVIASTLLGSPGAPVPETLALGRASDGTVALLFRFVATWRDDAEVRSAFVVLDPLEGALPPSVGASFETARILEPWRSSTVSWGRQPRVDLPRLTSVVRPRSGAPVRIDVTPLVRDWSQRLPDDHGIALIVQGRDAIGGAYSMGVSAGSGPRLEVYVR